MAKNLCLIALVMVLTACRPRFSSANPPPPPALPFKETFVDNHNVWSLNDSDVSSRQIDNGAMIIHVKTAKHSSWVTSPFIFPADVAAQAEITLPDVPETSNWDVGIAVRSDGQGDKSTYYLCFVNAVGDWFISARTAANSWKTIRKGKVGSRVDPKKPNTIRCAAKGDEYTFTFNDKQLVRVKDSTLPNDGNPKYVVMFLATYSQANIKAEFRNFEVIQAGK
jgi:hypothetical protein